MTFQKLAETRYSCRSFSDRPVEKELLDKIIDTARLAPTAVNHQPYRLFLMDSPAAKEAIHAATTCTFGAGTFLVVGAKAEEAWVRESDHRNFADVDASIVATHLMLAVHDLGLETTWVGYFDAPLLKKSCPAMEGYDLIAIFPIGYAAEDAVPSPRHSQRKSMEEVLEVL